MPKNYKCTTNDPKILRDFFGAIIKSDWSDFIDGDASEERYQQEIDWLGTDYAKKLCDNVGLSNKALCDLFEQKKNEKK